jgi:hypothetical protein
MPERPDDLPQWAARVSDLREGGYVLVRCWRCKVEAEMSVAQLRRFVRSNPLLKDLEPHFTCKCGNLGARLDARRALRQRGDRGDML